VWLNTRVVREYAVCACMRTVRAILGTKRLFTKVEKILTEVGGHGKRGEKRRETDNASCCYYYLSKSGSPYMSDETCTTTINIDSSVGKNRRPNYWPSTGSWTCLLSAHPHLHTRQNKAQHTTRNKYNNNYRQHKGFIGCKYLMKYRTKEGRKRKGIP